MGAVGGSTAPGQSATYVVIVKVASEPVEQKRTLSAHGTASTIALPTQAIVGGTAGNIVPRDVIALVKAFDSGDWATALTWHRKLFPLCRDMLGLSTNPIPIKTAMKLLGRDTGELLLEDAPATVQS